jgi:hypothetical protein
MENPSLKERIAAMQGKEIQQRAEKEQTEQQTTQQLVAEIADSIQGHNRMDVRHKNTTREANWDKQSGHGYTEERDKDINELSTGKADLKVKEQDLELSRAQIAELEQQFGAEAVADLKQQLQKELGELEEARAALAKKEKDFNPKSQKRVAFVQEQNEAAKDIPEFATNTVLQAHKKFSGKDHSARADELKKLALEEVGHRTEAQAKKEKFETEEKALADVDRKIQMQEIKVREADRVIKELRKEFSKGFQEYEAAIEKVRPQVEQLKREYQQKSGDTGFFSKKSSQKRATEIRQTLKDMETDILAVIDPSGDQIKNGYKPKTGAYNTFKGINFNWREMDGKIRAAGSKFTWRDNFARIYENRDTHLTFTRFSKNEVSQGHPRSSSVEKRMSQVVEETERVLSDSDKFLEEANSKPNEIKAKVRALFKLE